MLKNKKRVSAAFVDEWLDYCRANKEAMAKCLLRDPIRTYKTYHRYGMAELPKIVMDVCTRRKDNTIKMFHDIECYPKKTIADEKLEHVYTLYKVSLFDMANFHQDIHGEHEVLTTFDGAIDGVPRTRSCGISLDVLTIKFLGCRNVYTLAILEPARKGLCLSDEIILRDFLEELKESDFKLRYMIADAPKRAKLQGFKGHSGMFACPKCECSFNKNKNFPASTVNSTRRTLQSVDAALHTIETSDRPDKIKLSVLKGVQARSLLSEVEGFNILTHIPTEKMHLIDLGVVKKMTRLSFKCGQERPKTNFHDFNDVKVLDQKLEELKLPTEFPRRTRGIDIGNWKSQEFRNMILALFPTVIKAILSPACKKVWYLMVYISRALHLPKHLMIQTALTDTLLHDWYRKYEAAFSEHNCTYNTHIMTHVLEVRALGPITETSAYPYEDTYGMLKKGFKEGTCSSGKQAMENSLLVAKGGHACKKSLTFRGKEGDTQKRCDSILYTRQGQLFRCMALSPSRELMCKKIRVEDGLFLHEALNFNDVLCYQVNPEKLEEDSDTMWIVSPNDVVGKGILSENIISVVLQQVLLEQ